MIVIQSDYENAVRYCNSVFGGTFFEFMFFFVDHKEVFRELDRFIWESKHCLRFKNEYSGNVLIELTGWNDREDFEFSEYFDAFMYYLKSRKDKLNTMFLIRGECSSLLFKHLKKHFDLIIIDPEKGEVPMSGGKVAIGFGNRGE